MDRCDFPIATFLKKKKDNGWICCLWAIQKFSYGRDGLMTIHYLDRYNCHVENAPQIPRVQIVEF